MAGQELPQLLVGVLLAALQDLHCRQDEARGAEAALDGRLVHKGLLDVRELAVGAQQPLQGADVLALRPDRQVDAGVIGLSVNEDVAGAALPHLAALLHGGHPEVVAEHIGEAGPHVHRALHILTVQVEMDRLILHHVFLRHHRSPPASFTAWMNARRALSTAMCIRKSLAARQESRG